MSLRPTERGGSTSESVRNRVVILTAALVLTVLSNLSCGGGSAPPSPSQPNSPPTNSPSLPYLNGEWSGTLEAAGVPTRSIATRLIQQADCVDGGWNTVPVSEPSRWVGAISAFAKPSSLDGFMSFEYQVGSRLCTGLGTLVGDADDNTATLRWTITEFDTQACSGGVPGQMTVRLRRDR
jgi:hypothetical protein